VLQEGEIRRVGETEYRKVNVRVICATNRDLKSLLESGAFIHDLYHRIDQFPIRMPPLSERREDIPLLVDHFIGMSGSRKNPPVRSIAPDALSVLVARDWRENNVRELRNVVSLAVDLAHGEQITLRTVRQTLELRGEAGGDGSETAGVPAHAAPSGAGPALDAHGGLFALDRALMTELFRRAHPDAPKEQKPYYRAQREFSGKVIVECLRFSQWKLRPASRLLGISPVKLRQDFREYLEFLLEQALAAQSPEAGPGEVERCVCLALDLPAAVVARKLSELGLTLSGTQVTGVAEPPA
jgi:DNA-binding NtrC family response regulator